MDKAKLESVIEACDGANTFCIAIVAVGLLGESFEPPIIHGICKFIFAAFKWMVILGVAGEFVLHIRQSRASKRLVALQNTESDQLKFDVAQANLATEELREENLKLREEMSPRRLSAAQISAIRDIASHVKAHDMDVLIVGSVTETKEFADLITLPFRFAGWDIRLWAARPEIINRGISISFWSHAKPESWRTVADLLAAFSLAGIECEGSGFFADDKRGVPMGSDPQQQQKKMAEIRMIVGEKPHPKVAADSPTSPR